MKSGSSNQRGGSLNTVKVRPALWFAAFAVLGACGLAIFLRSNSSPEPSAITITTPRNASMGSAPKSAGKFDAPTVKRLASLTANAKARELYGQEPFDDTASLQPEQSGWKWTARRGQGIGDFEATVHLGSDGKVISVEVFRLVSPPSFQLR